MKTKLLYIITFSLIAFLADGMDRQVRKGRWTFFKKERVVLTNTFSKITKNEFSEIKGLTIFGFDGKILGTNEYVSDSSILTCLKLKYQSGKEETKKRISIANEFLIGCLIKDKTIYATKVKRRIRPWYLSSATMIGLNSLFISSLFLLTLFVLSFIKPLNKLLSIDFDESSKNKLITYTRDGIGKTSYTNFGKWVLSTFVSLIGACLFAVLILSFVTKIEVAFSLFIFISIIVFTLIFLSINPRNYAKLRKRFSAERIRFMIIVFIFIIPSLFILFHKQTSNIHNRTFFKTLKKVRKVKARGAGRELKMSEDRKLLKIKKQEF